MEVENFSENEICFKVILFWKMMEFKDIIAWSTIVHDLTRMGAKPIGLGYNPSCFYYIRAYV